MAPKTRARDRSSLRHYRIELPNLIDDMGLSVYAFRLYVHLKRVAEDEGSCWQSARTLAEACNMSSGRVSEAKDELEQKQLIVRHPKIVRGGIGDDITIVDIWPQNFARYAPESAPSQESDHHTITSTPEVITTRSLGESDRHTITSGESDQDTITLMSKRSPGDPKKSQYHIGVITTPSPPSMPERSNGDGDDFYRELRRRSVGQTKARQIASMGSDPTRILALIDNRPNASDPNSLGRIIIDILDGVAGDRVAAVAQSAPLQATRPNLPETTVAPAEMLRQMTERRR